MTNDITLHGVSKIIVEKEHKLGEHLGYVKHILIKTSNGDIEISLFSNEQKSLKIGD